MKIVRNDEMLKQYIKVAVDVSPERPILIDKFLEDAIEVEADAISDGNDAFVPSIMQHIEYAGVHSGDSACVIPPVSLPEKHQKIINDYTIKLAKELNVIGLINVQYAIYKDEVYILEANPRASRTVPLVSKVCAIPMAKIATSIMLGKKLKEFNLSPRKVPYYGVKEAVLPFNMFPEVDPVLGPEMKSTGEVLGLAKSFGQAFFKSQEATQYPLPASGTVLITVADRDKEKIIEIAKNFAKLNFKILATKGTKQFLENHGIYAQLINKVHEGRPNIIDAIKNKEINLIINTPAGDLSEHDDSYIRKNAIRYKIPYITTTPAAFAATMGIAECLNSKYEVRSLQEYHKELMSI